MLLNLTAILIVVFAGDLGRDVTLSATLNHERLLAEVDVVNIFMHHSVVNYEARVACEGLATDTAVY